MIDKKKLGVLTNIVKCISPLFGPRQKKIFSEECIRGCDALKTTASADIKRVSKTFSQNARPVPTDVPTPTSAAAPAPARLLDKLPRPLPMIMIYFRYRPKCSRRYGASFSSGT